MPRISLDGRMVNISDRQLADLNVLDSCRHGGFATVHNYVSGTSDPKCITPGVSTIQFISKFSYKRRCERILERAKGYVAPDALHEQARTEVVESLMKTLAGDTSDGHRQGHVRCYVHSDMGIKVHLETTDGVVDGRKVKVPVLDADGVPTVASIMVAVLEVSRKVHVKGEYAPTKSRPLTIAKEAVTSYCEDGMLSYKYLSLKDNYDALNIDKESVVPAEIASLMVETD